MLGPLTSSSAQLISTIADVYQIPLVVFWATSPYLSAKDQYPNVWRTVSSDYIRMQAWVQLCLQFQWAHVIVWNENSLYGAGAAASFEETAAAVGISTTILSITSKEDIVKGIATIKASKIKIILAPCTTYFMPIINMSIAAGLMGKDTGYIWIIGDLVAELLSDTYQDVYNGALATLEPNTLLLQTFNTTANQPFIEMAYAQVLQAYNSVNLSSPFRNAAFGVPKQADMTSVRSLMWTACSMPTSLARAVIVIADVVNGGYIANGNQLPTAAQVTSRLKTVSEAILGATVAFDANQDFGDSMMGITNLRHGDPWHTVGTWSESQGFLYNEGEQFIWPDGTTRIPDDGVALEHVWTFTSSIGVITAVFATALIICYLITLVIMIKNYYTPVFRLASPNSLLIILLGCFCFTAQCYFYIERPNRLFCNFRIWLYYMGLAFIYSALIAKTWRVWWVFREANSLKRNILISNTRLMIYTLLLILPAFFFCVLRTGISDDSDRRVIARDHTRVDVVCYAKQVAWQYLQLAYTTMELLAALILSWLTRNVPSGFNETKYVFVSVYSVMTVGILGVITSGATEASDPKLSIAVTVLSACVCSAVIWGTLFIHKLYIALMRPDRNTGQLMRHNPIEPPLSIAAMTEGFATDTMQVPLMRSGNY